MSNFVKLPSGEITNTDKILNAKWRKQYESPDSNVMTNMLIVQMESETSGGGSWERKYKDTDARALYAYLSAQAVTIGEDGKPVEAEMEMVR